MRGAQAGAVTFLQRFSSALALNPHIHSVVPDGVWVEEWEGARLVPLPPPTQEEVERLVAVVRHRVPRRLERRACCRRRGPKVLPVDAFLRRLAALAPPPGSNLVRFHGLFAPGAALRPRVVPEPW